MSLEGKSETKVSLKGTILTNQQVFDMIEKHKNNTENPHAVTAEQLTGVLPLANGGTGAASAAAALANIADLHEHAEHPGCFYRYVNGVEEWINPPMVGGKEYRTTERNLGKTVYVKNFDCGICGKGRTSIAINLPSNYKIVRYFSEGSPFFYGDKMPGENPFDLWVSVANNYINVHRNADGEAQYYCAIFYTKD